MDGLGLASVLRQLRAELNEAMDDGEGERLRFELGPVKPEHMNDSTKVMRRKSH